jgi:RND family efflux transporter MFP subunit
MSVRTRILVGLCAIAAIAALAVPRSREALVGILGARSGTVARADASPEEAAEAPVPAASSAGSETPEGSPESESPRATPLPVAAVVVGRGPFVQTIRATGRAEAPRRVELSPRVTERVLAVHVTEGDRVREGDTLVTLDPRSFEIALQEAEAKRAMAEADNRVTLLDDDGADSTRRALTKHRSGLTYAEQSIARATLDLEGTRITAPFAGDIAAVGAVVGARAQAGQPLVTLVDLSEVRIPAEVLESHFGPLVPGAAARVRVAAFPDDVYRGRVVALGPELDATRGTGVAFVAIDNPQRRIRPGMYAEVEIESARYEDRIAVPRRAVLERDRKLLVFKTANARAEWQYVETGLESETMIEITRGLAPGDTVLVDGHLTLAHAAPVSVTIVEE